MELLETSSDDKLDSSSSGGVSGMTTYLLSECLNLVGSSASSSKVYEVSEAVKFSSYLESLDHLDSLSSEVVVTTPEVRSVSDQSDMVV